MRGKGGGKDSTIVLAGITPAYAGKSLKLPSCFFVDQDHPRLCGEKLTYPSCSAGSAGSPPPMRGKVNATQILPIAMRITPAYAGKRHYYDVSYVGGEDHPRLCGEKL
mgnify:CR=1 FL=1